MLLLVQSRGIVSPEEVTELQGLEGLAAQLYGHLETAEIETGLMGHHSMCERHRLPIPAASTLCPAVIAVKGPPMERTARRWGSSWDQPLTGMSAGVKAYRPTVTRCVAGGGALVRMATTGLG